MRPHGGTRFSEVLGALNKDPTRLMDDACRKDLPSPTQGGVRHPSIHNRRESSSQEEPKSPPKSVRFTDEDEVIDQSSTKKQLKDRSKKGSSKPLSPSIKSSSRQGSAESESRNQLSSSKQGMSSPDDDEDDEDEYEVDGGSSSEDDEPIDKNLLNKLDNIKKNLRDNQYQHNSSQGNQFES